MKSLVTALGSYVTGDEIADAVLDYGHALTLEQRTDLIDIPVLGDGGSTRLRLAVGWLIQLHTLGVDADGQEIVDPSTTDVLRARMNHLSGDSDGGTLGDAVPNLHYSASAERAAVGSEVQATIAMAVEALPEEQREVFLLRKVADLPFKEIAEIIGVPENTVKSRMRYALDRLKQALCEFEEYARALR
jgi:RNA polymerase sigma factor (sigma-70 family)